MFSVAVPLLSLPLGTILTVVTKDGGSYTGFYANCTVRSEREVALIIGSLRYIPDKIVYCDAIGREVVEHIMPAELRTQQESFEHARTFLLSEVHEVTCALLALPHWQLEQFVPRVIMTMGSQVRVCDDLLDFPLLTFPVGKENLAARCPSVTGEVLSVAEHGGYMFVVYDDCGDRPGVFLPEELTLLVDPT